MNTDTNNQRFSRADKARLHRQRLAALARRHAKPQRRLANERQAIPGAERMLHALQKVEYARAELQSADQCLRATLSIVPLAKAYEEFVAEGGVSSADWQTWLEALPLRKHNVLRFKPRSPAEIEELEADEVEDQTS